MYLQTMNSSIPRSTPPQIPQAIYQAPNGSGFEEENPYMYEITVFCLMRNYLRHFSFAGFSRKDAYHNSKDSTIQLVIPLCNQ